MDKKINIIKRATDTNKHHFFGFHDLIAFNKSGNKLLSLAVDVINRPPLAGEKASVGYSLWEREEFIKLGESNAYNFPQGARQQWLTDDIFIVNNQVGDDWGADLYDTSLGKKIDSFNSTAHCITADGKYAFGIDYSRLHRLGGYGYIGIQDKFSLDAAPIKQGIWKLNLNTKAKELLLSIREVSLCDKKTSNFNGAHHFVTHLVLNPSNTRIAFLHRFFLPDGGIRTRLMSIGINGDDLRCLAVGFLSHFDWKDDDTIFIWGRAGANIDALRSNAILSHPILLPFLNIAKQTVRKIISTTSNQLSMSFLLVKDAVEPNIVPVAKGVLIEDGHPMFNPIDRNIIINDTYPNDEKIRTLMLYYFAQNKRIDIGQFRMIDDKPDTSLFKQYTENIDSQILEKISLDLISFTRSGLHCDFHPRWNANGTMVAFDSIHEGSRQIYIADVNEYIT